VNRLRRAARGVGLLLSLGGCSALLPRGEAVTEGPWKSYAEAQATFDQIVPGQTRVGDLKQLHFDVQNSPNITILNYSDILRRFIPTPALDPQGLDGGVRACLAARTACVGYEAKQKVVNRRRHGNFWLDFLNFKRQVDVNGWRFSGMLLIVGDRVVYKLTGGQPVIHEQEDTHNPLGPLQGIGESTGALVR